MAQHLGERNVTCNVTSLVDYMENTYGLQIKHYRAVRDVYRVETMRAHVLCVKGFELPHNEVSFIAHVMQHVSHSEFRQTPQILPTLENSLWSLFRGRRYIVSNWVTGKSPRFNDRRDLTKAVRTLAEFHKYSCELPKKHICPCRSKFATLEKRIHTYHQVIAKELDKKAARPFVHLCDMANQLVREKAVKEAIKAETDARSFIHGDYNYPNLVVDSAGVMQMIDFDNTTMQVRMMDLSHIIHRNFPWQAKGASRLIEVYDRVRSIHHRDRKLLISLLCTPYPLVRSLQRHAQRKRLILEEMPSLSKVREFTKWLQST